MRLAKPHIDIGVTTDQLEPMLEFWQNEIGLPFEEELRLTKGACQYRHALMGSVFKLNHVEAPLPPSVPTGYRELLIAREGLRCARSLKDPDGNLVTLVPPGTHGIERIGVRLAVRDANVHRRFYAQALGLPDVPEAGGNSFLCGDSVILFENASDVVMDPPLEGKGFRYITMQIFKVNDEHAFALAHGAREGAAPRTLGAIARMSLLRDPDGNWVELSQRASLTGSLD